MKTIGLLGGMSWESTVPYYRIINQAVNERLGGLHSAKVVLYSVDFDGIERLQHAGEWEEAGDVLIDAARRLETAGADFLVLCTNTMHKLAPQIESALGIPLLHIADATALAVREAAIDTIGLLGTRFTMTKGFYQRALEKHGIETVIPDPSGVETVNRIIYDELVVRDLRDPSRDAVLEVMDGLVREGAEGVVLGCTELPFLIRQSDTSVPVFDTTAIHCRKALGIAMGP